MRLRFASRWMRSLNYGRPLRSRLARATANYYRVLIALLVVALLVVNGWRATPPARMVIGAAVGLYVVYVLVRITLLDRLAARYYQPRVQFLRAQAGILGLTVVLFVLERGWPGSPAMASEWQARLMPAASTLWPLYILPLMIVGEHCSTTLSLITLSEVSGCLGLLALWGGVPLWESLQQILALLLLGFVTHYLIRNVNARDLSIARYRRLWSLLAENTRALRDPKQTCEVALEASVRAVGAYCGSLWQLDGRGESLQALLCQPNTPGTCPWLCGEAADRVLPLSANWAPTVAARTSTPCFALRRRRPPQAVADACVEAAPMISQAAFEIAIPIPAFQTGQPESLAVLCLEFLKQPKAEEIEQLYHQALEFTGQLMPLFYFASVLEQLQALQRLSQLVSRELNEAKVLEALLELATATLGFDYAMVWLVDEVEGILRCYRTRNVPQGWVPATVHRLDGNDVRVQVVRTAQPQMVGGLDGRGGPVSSLLVPVAAAGVEACIGVLEAGCYRPSCSEVLPDQLMLLRSLVAQTAPALVNARLYEQARWKAEVLTSLHLGGQAILSAALESDALLGEMARMAWQVLGADIFILYGYDDTKHRVELLSMRGDLWGDQPLSLSLGEGNILDVIIAERKPQYVPEAQTNPLLTGYGGADGHRVRTFAQRQGVASFAGVPLLVEERLLGIMCINYRSRRRFTDDERQIIELFGQQVALAMENARLRRRDRALAVEEERLRVSHALHESVTQELFAIAMQARAALHHLERDVDVPTARRNLQEILDCAEAAKAKIGYIVGELREQVEVSDLRTALADMADRLRQYHQVEISGLEQADLPHPQAGCVTRIVREALNNVVRHANCRNVAIRCSRDAGQLCLQITDDGVGFDVERARRGKHTYGLKDMEKYARQIGGELTVRSRPGTGTAVVLRVPLPVEDEGWNEKESTAKETDLSQSPY